MNAVTKPFGWADYAVLIGRLVFAGLFIMAASSKFFGIGASASYIAAAGFPAPLILAWLAALFETVLAF